MKAETQKKMDSIQKRAAASAEKSRKLWNEWKRLRYGVNAI